MKVRQVSSGDGVIMDAVLRLHQDGQGRSVKRIGLELRATGLQVSDYRLELMAKTLRIEGLIPGRLMSPAYVSRGPQPDAPVVKVALPWHERLKRAHLARERRIRRLATAA